MYKPVYNYWNNFGPEKKVFRRNFYFLRYRGSNYRFFANMLNWAKLYPNNTMNPRLLLNFKN